MNECGGKKALFVGLKWHIFLHTQKCGGKLNNKYLRMMNLLFTETSPSPIKFVMSKLGMCGNTLRLPMSPVTELTEKLLIEEMNKILCGK